MPEGIPHEKKNELMWCISWVSMEVTIFYCLFALFSTVVQGVEYNVLHKSK